jgi:hypothetical protein
MNTGVASTDDKLVVGVPHIKTDIAVDYHPALLDGFALTGAVHYEGARAATNTNNSFAPAYTTLDLGARYTTTFLKHHMTARFQVLNVTDTFYYVSIADGTIVGSPGANTAYLAAPRTFLASLEFDYWRIINEASAPETEQKLQKRTPASQMRLRRRTIAAPHMAARHIGPPDQRRARIFGGLDGTGGRSVKRAVVLRLQCPDSGIPSSYRSSCGTGCDNGAPTFPGYRRQKRAARCPYSG